MSDLSKNSLAILVVAVMIVSIAGTLLVLNAVEAASGAAVSTAKGVVYLVVAGPPAPPGPTPVPVSMGGVVGATVG
ncbi:MAG: hypothetical protein NTY90_03495 [Candidatus Micrarchaeota archaeon]|nr:hypothetical protein [Candidatus Micrarchaeota archaeon]